LPYGVSRGMKTCASISARADGREQPPAFLQTDATFLIPLLAREIATEDRDL
jgi:hypothetical protein